VAKLSNLVRAIVSFQSQLITICVIFFGAQAVFAQTMTIGQLIAFNMLANNVVNPLVALVFTASGYETFRLAKKKLSELEPPQQAVMPLADDQLNLVGDIVFKDVWFQYPDTEDYVLKGINLTIKQGDIVGIVGGSGSGKSTLAALIMGFYGPTQGSVQINGYDLALLPKKQLRSRIASVQQTSFLFHTSVLQNIHLGRLNAGVEEIQQSLTDSGSSEFVDAMPQKFMTHLSEDGDNLSGGQRQRLAIARALVRNADILLFDEATSALDNQTEDTIKHTIHQACQDKTGIIIAHRLNTLTYCNQLVVMTHGEIEAQGSHEELIEGDNSYKAMYESMVKR
jgi:subfamily B ATP-binding cassette protein HlyB/CyaB